MLDGYYRNRLEKDLAYWQSQGWIDEKNAAAIWEAKAPNQTVSRLPIILGFLGAILIGFSAMTFVAANWEDIPRIARLVLLLSGMLLAYLTAWHLTRRGYSLAADAAILVGTGIYGAAIMLIAQIYHIEAHFPDGVLLWSLGALLAAALTLSRGALIVAILGSTYWTFTEMMDFGWDIHWPFLPVWALLTSLAIAMRWSPARHLTLISILSWFVLATGQIFALLDWSALAALSFLIAVASMLFALCHVGLKSGNSGDLREVWLEYATTARHYTLFSILGLAFLLRLAGIEDFSHSDANTDNQMWMVANIALLVLTIGLALLAWRQNSLRKIDIVALAIAGVFPFFIAYAFGANLVSVHSLGVAVAAAAFVIGLAIWTIDYGQNRHSRTAVNLGLAAFGFEVLYLYFATFGTLLDTALFFLTGGLLLIGLGWFLNMLRVRLVRREAVS